MLSHPLIYVGDEALRELVAFCCDQGLARFALIADDNTYAALGGRAEAALRGQGWDVRTVVLKGDDIIADSRHVMQVLLGLDHTPRTFVAVGSGTITDITRFVSHRSAQPFISLPTAASVDGYTSIGAPMVIEGEKITVPCHGPLAVFADLPTLAAAPRPLIAAGLGDMLAKFTSIADWELGHVLWDEPFDPAIAARSRKAAQECAVQADAIARCEPAGIRALFLGLIESGLCMLDFGETRPASGYEHHASHFWEMKLLREGRRSILHGAKVGLAVLASAARYAIIRELSAADAATRLAAAQLPDREAVERGIKQAYGPIADKVIAGHAAFLKMNAANFDALKARVLGNWDAVQAIAATVPPPSQIAAWLRQAGGPTSPAELGLSDDEFAQGLAFGGYYRPRFTIAKLSQLLGIA